MHVLIINKTEVDDDRITYAQYDVISYESGIYRKNICAESGLDCEAVRDKIRRNYSNIDEQDVRISNLHDGTPKPHLITTIDMPVEDVVFTSTDICEAVDYAIEAESITTPSQTYNLEDDVPTLLNKLSIDELALLFNELAGSH